MSVVPELATPICDHVPPRAASAWPTHNDRGYHLPDQPGETPRPLKIICIGAGFSGVTVAWQVETRFRHFSLTVYEQAAACAGTWFWNNYPGIQCDIPAVNYQLSFNPKPDWLSYYSAGEEIREYIENTVSKFGLGKYMHFRREVVGARWDDQQHKWHIRVRNLDTREEFSDSCDVFINAGGVLDKVRWPQLKGMDKFKGKLAHTARWPQGLDYKGKRVAVMGSGSSGIQIVPKILPDVSVIYHWIRSPTWITPGFAQRYAGPKGGNFFYTEEQKKRFRDDPQHSLMYRKMLEAELNQRFKFVILGTPESQAAKDFAVAEMTRKLNGNHRIANHIIPGDKFNVGCRRPTPGNGYLESLSDPKITVFTEGFGEFTETGFRDVDGKEYEIDVFICATGFDTSFIPGFPIEAHGVNLQDVMREEVQSYLSYAVCGFPNYFSFFGPFGPTGHGSGVPNIEVLARAIFNACEKISRENILSITPKKAACDDFQENCRLFLQRTAWNGPCSSWFKRTPTSIPIMFPGSRITFMKLLEKFRGEDWDYVYEQGNRFRFLGNGFHISETDGSDNTWYWGALDDTGKMPDYRSIAEMYIQKDV